jgi:hypothetical protein
MLAGAGFIVTACGRPGTGPAASPPPASGPGAAPPSWESRLLEALPALGHRNWIVVADSAFPLQISPGIETIVSNEDHFTVLEKVLAALDKSRHVKPHVWLDKELDFVPEELSPGADACRGRLGTLLQGRDAKPVLHEDLIARLDQAGRTFKILMIKTTLAVPYTSVFLELGCGYWPPESEAVMRARMKAGGPR